VVETVPVDVTGALMGPAGEGGEGEAPYERVDAPTIPTEPAALLRGLHPPPSGPSETLDTPKRTVWSQLLSWTRSAPRSQPARPVVAPPQHVPTELARAPSQEASSSNPAGPQMDRTICKPPSTAPQQDDGQERCGHPEDVHVAMTLEPNYLRGAIAAMNSILKNAHCSRTVLMHLITSAQDGGGALATVVRAALPTLRFQLYVFRDAHVRTLISRAMREDLSNSLNYARFYLHSTLPTCVRRVVYLDTDLVVTGHIEDLYDMPLHDNIIGSPEFCKFKIQRYFSSSFWGNKTMSGSVWHKRESCYFNPGVMLVDLQAWRQASITSQIEKWMLVQHNQEHIYQLGSLPPMLLVLSGRNEAIPESWNKHDLGGPCREIKVEAANVLHWSGNGKPWRRLTKNQDYACPVDHVWEQYDVKMTLPSL